MNNIERKLEWTSVNECPHPPHAQMAVLSVENSQRGEIDYGYWSIHDQAFMVQSSLGWDNIKHYNGVVTHWMRPPKAV